MSDNDILRAYEALDSESFYSEIATETERKAAQAVQDLLPLANKIGREELAVLDIGCGHGHFLESARRTFPHARLAGFEIQQQSAAVCRAKGFTVFTGNLEEVTGKYSLISLLDVVEHLRQPIEALRACRDLLQNDGYVYIHTPRCCLWDSFFLRLSREVGIRQLSFLWFRARLSIYHLQLWTEKSLSICLQRSGFEVTKVRAIRELSCPVKTYISASLGGTHSRALVKLTTVLATALFVWLGTLKNKVVCLGRVHTRNSCSAADPLTGKRTRDVAAQ